MKGYANPQLLIAAEELSRAVAGEGGVRPLLLDLRTPDAYAAGHIPGALHLDLFATRGVTASTPVVVYDDQSGVRAARAFWFLEYFGHPSVRVLDGGFGAWTHGGFPITRDAAPAVVSEWHGSRQNAAIATWREVEAAIGQAGSVIL